MPLFPEEEEVPAIAHGDDDDDEEEEDFCFCPCVRLSSLFDSASAMVQSKG